MLFSMHRNCMGVPIYERPPPKYTATRILQILLDPNIEQSLIAKGRPIEVEKSSTFVVDLTCLKHPDDVKKDMYGRWDYSGSHPEVFRCSFNEFDNVSIEKCAPGATGDDVYYLRRIRSSHPSNPNFRRLIAFVHSKLFFRTMVEKDLFLLRTKRKSNSSSLKDKVNNNYERNLIKCSAS